MTLSPTEDFEARAFALSVPSIRLVNTRIEELKTVIADMRDVTLSQSVSDCFDELLNGLDDLRHDSSLESFIEKVGP